MINKIGGAGGSRSFCLEQNVSREARPKGSGHGQGETVGREGGLGHGR
jgi:hypothetical protein